METQDVFKSSPEQEIKPLRAPAVLGDRSGVHAGTIVILTVFIDPDKVVRPCQDSFTNYAVAPIF
jgi:hypothetical protein